MATKGEKCGVALFWVFVLCTSAVMIMKLNHHPKYHCEDGSKPQCPAGMVLSHAHGHGHGHDHDDHPHGHGKPSCVPGAAEGRKLQEEHGEGAKDFLGMHMSWAWKTETHEDKDEAHHEHHEHRRHHEHMGGEHHEHHEHHAHEEFMKDRAAFNYQWHKHGHAHGGDHHGCPCHKAEHEATAAGKSVAETCAAEPRCVWVSFEGHPGLRAHWQQHGEHGHDHDHGNLFAKNGGRCFGKERHEAWLKFQANKAAGFGFDPEKKKDDAGCEAWAKTDIKAFMKSCKAKCPTLCKEMWAKKKDGKDKDDTQVDPAWCKGWIAKDKASFTKECYGGKSGKMCPSLCSAVSFTKGWAMEKKKMSGEHEHGYEHGPQPESKFWQMRHAQEAAVRNKKMGKGKKKATMMMAKKASKSSAPMPMCKNGEPAKFGMHHHHKKDHKKGEHQHQMHGHHVGCRRALKLLHLLAVVSLLISTILLRHVIAKMLCCCCKRRRAARPELIVTPVVVTRGQAIAGPSSRKFSPIPIDTKDVVIAAELIQ